MKNRTTAQEPATVARLNKPGLRDPRLLVGVMLILISVFAVVTVLNLGNKTDPYYVAKSDIEVGQKITTDQLSVVEVRLGDASAHYLAESSELADGLYATRKIPAGELVAEDNLTEKAHDQRRKISISIDTVIASNYKSGEFVDLWVSPKNESGNTYGDPELITQRAEVASVTGEESIIGGTGKTSIVLLIEPGALDQALKAINNSDKINLVPSNYAEGA